jgi:hypothetical protein
MTHYGIIGVPLPIGSEEADIHRFTSMPLRECAGSYFTSTYLSSMRAKKISLICAVCAIALISGSWWANAAVNVGDDGRLSAAKPAENKIGMIVAQAWWDAAYNAATAQRQAAAQRRRLWFGAKTGATAAPPVERTIEKSN